MDTDLQSLVQLLDASLDPQRHKQAELALHNAEVQNGFSLKLLQIVASDAYAPTSRLASALCFKNFIKRNWTDEDGKYKIPESEVNAIKDELIGLMIAVPIPIQAQLGDAVSVIAESDFYERWDTLVDDLVSRLKPDNAVVNNGVLQVAHSIFRRWRPLFRSDALFTEINHVLQRFGTPFLSLLQNTDHSIEEAVGNQKVLKELFKTLELSMSIIYDLSSQDLPPVFEDNLNGLNGLFVKYLNYDNSLLRTDDDTEPGPLELVKTSIMEVLILYTQKYEDAFGALIPSFVQISWNLLTAAGPETKYDLLVSRALAFLTTVTRLPKYAEPFGTQATLSQVVEGVVLPNIALRESDIELFEDEPIEFTRRDLEGTDIDSRRRAATEFLRQLMSHFDELVTKVVMQYIENHLHEFSTKHDWKAKDTAVYLFSSIAAKGVLTAGQGVKTVNPHVDLINFFKQHIASDLIAESTNVLLQVDAIKFLYVFRSQMSGEQWREVIPPLVKHLESPNYVIHTYCAIVIERVLALNVEHKDSLFPRGDLVPLSKTLLQRLFTLITKNAAPEKVQENEFLARCAMRVLIVLREDMLPFFDFLLASFVTIIEVIRHNPSNPRFYYYLFEAVGALIRFTATTQYQKLESSLEKPFGHILSNDVQEFMPYVFQLLAAVLEANPVGLLPDFYKNLIDPLLSPTLWESRGNIPALVRLLSALLPRAADLMVESNQIVPILVIFQKLIASKSSESQAFDLLETVFTSLPLTALEQYFTEIFRLLLIRLQGSRTETLSLRFVRFYYFMVDRDDKGLGADAVSNFLDQVQAGVYTQLYLGIILPDTQKLVRPIDKKIAAIALTKTLSDSKIFADKYAKGWGFSAVAFVRLMKDPPLPLAENDAIQDQDVDDMSFGVGFTQLSTCKRPPTDAYPEITDLPSWCAKYLAEANQRHGGRLADFVQNRTSGDTQSALSQLLQR